MRRWWDTLGTTKKKPNNPRPSPPLTPSRELGAME